MGPDLSGWCHLWYSPADGYCHDGADKAAHGGVPHIQWFIQQIGQYYKNTQVRLLDVLDIHCYPEATGSSKGSSDLATIVSALRSTRELYDENHIAEAWFVEPMGYIKRIRQFIALYAPWMQLSCTEWSYVSLDGWNDDSLLGSVATAEALALYAREGVDIATHWVTPKAGSKVEAAFKLLTNYDGKGSRISGQVVSATSSNEEVVTSYAFKQNNMLRLLLVCKANTATQVTIDLSKYSLNADGQGFLLDATHNTAPAGTYRLSNGLLAVSLPRVSATLISFAV
jgi:hypothetical protein